MVYDTYNLEVITVSYTMVFTKNQQTFHYWGGRGSYYQTGHWVNITRNLQAQ